MVIFAGFYCLFYIANFTTINKYYASFNYKIQDEKTFSISLW